VLTALPLAGFLATGILVFDLARRLNAEGSLLDLFATPASLAEQEAAQGSFGERALVYGVLGILVAAGSALLSGGLSLFYAAHALKNPALDDGEKKRWAAGLLLFGHFFLMLLYWRRHILTENSGASS
jgi:hypothetical protein